MDMVWKEEKKFYPAESVPCFSVQPQGQLDSVFLGIVHTSDPISQNEPIEPVCGNWAVTVASSPSQGRAASAGC